MYVVFEVYMCVQRAHRTYVLSKTIFFSRRCLFLFRAKQGDITIYGSFGMWTDHANILRSKPQLNKTINTFIRHNIALFLKTTSYFVWRSRLSRTRKKTFLILILLMTFFQNNISLHFPVKHLYYYVRRFIIK